jgi:hypothetical protein
VTWIEKDTFFTENNGEFVVNCTRSQLSNHLFFKKSGFSPSRHFLLSRDSNRILIDTPIVLYDRKRNWFDARKNNEGDLGLEVKEAVSKFKINFSQTYLFKLPNSDKIVKGLFAEISDSSMILLIVKEYIDNPIKKSNILNKKITGIGVAFKNGEKNIYGNAAFHKIKMLNYYFIETKELEEKNTFKF